MRLRPNTLANTLSSVTADDRMRQAYTTYPCPLYVLFHRNFQSRQHTCENNFDLRYHVPVQRRCGRMRFSTPAIDVHGVKWYTWAFLVNVSGLYVMSG